MGVRKYVKNKSLFNLTNSPPVCECGYHNFHRNKCKWKGKQEMEYVITFPLTEKIK